MAKKGRRLTKAAAVRPARWTVRGVAPQLQKAAGDHARMRGQTLGQWLSEVVGAAIAEPADLGTPVPGGSWREMIELRLGRLEAALAAGAATGVAQPQSAPDGNPPDGEVQPAA